MTKNPDLKLCPFCGVKLAQPTREFDGTTCWRHPARKKPGRFFDHDDCIGNVDLISQQDFDGWNRRASPWRPIATAPKDGRDIILWLRDGMPVIRRWAHTGWADHSSSEDWEDGFFTHWAELPEPPEVGK